MMAGARAGAHRPTRHPAAAALALGVAFAAGSADALHSAVWADAAARCFTAIDAGQAIDTGPFGLRVVMAGEGSDWPEQIHGQGLVEIWQVRYGAWPGPAEAREVTRLYTDLAAGWQAAGYRVQPSKRVPDLSDGLASELVNPAPNPRGCRVAVSFMSSPPDGVVLFSVSEMARQPCGVRPWEDL